MSWLLDYLWGSTTYLALPEGEIPSLVAAAGRNVPPGVDIKAIPEALATVSADLILAAGKRLRPTPPRDPTPFNPSELDEALASVLPRLRHVVTRIVDHSPGRVVDRPQE